MFDDLFYTLRRHAWPKGHSPFYNLGSSILNFCNILKEPLMGKQFICFILLPNADVGLLRSSSVFKLLVCCNLIKQRRELLCFCFFQWSAEQINECLFWVLIWLKNSFQLKLINYFIISPNHLWHFETNKNKKMAVVHLQLITCVDFIAGDINFKCMPYLWQTTCIVLYTFCKIPHNSPKEHLWNHILTLWLTKERLYFHNSRKKISS